MVFHVTVVKEAQIVMERQDMFVWDAETIRILGATMLTFAKSVLKDILKEIRW